MSKVFYAISDLEINDIKVPGAVSFGCQPSSNINTLRYKQNDMPIGITANVQDAELKVYSLPNGVLSSVFGYTVNGNTITQKKHIFKTCKIKFKCKNPDTVTKTYHNCVFCEPNVDVSTISNSTNITPFTLKIKVFPNASGEISTTS